MNGLSGSDSPERGLLPYSVILAATNGNPEAMKLVIQHYAGYIAYLSMRKVKDENGGIYFGVNNDMRERLKAKLMSAVLSFNAEIPG